MKKCTRCKVTRLLSEFHKCKRLGYKSRCKLCRNELKREYDKKNVEKIKKYIESRKEINKKYLKEYHKDYYPNNREKILAKGRNWKKQNPNKHAANERKRRARKMEVSENYTFEDAQTTMRKFGSKCFNCSSKENLQIDHNMPF